MSAAQRDQPGAAEEDTLRRQREQEADQLLALLDEVAALSEGEFDSAEEIRRMRAERDDQLCPNR
jgi:hypothetical protein